MSLPYCIYYKAHVIYSDGRVYKDYGLIAHCKTMASAKAIATKNQNRINRQRQSEHHATILDIILNSNQ